MPKTRKPKSDSTSDSDSGPDDKNPPPSKKSKDTSSSNGGGKAGKPNQWVLEKMRQVRINDFRGRKMVDIREFYEKDGEILPGKKGISLSITQWKKLMEVAAEVDKALLD